MNKDQQDIDKLKKNIKKLAGGTEDINLNKIKFTNQSTDTPDIKTAKKKDINEFNQRNGSLSEEEEYNCYDIFSSPLFVFISTLIVIISIILFIYLIREIDLVTHPEEIGVKQEESMFFDYLVTDIFTIHNNFISSHGRNFVINFNSPYGVNLNNMSIKPNGTITATNCNFSEINFQKIKIRGSTILSITPQNDEIMLDLPAVSMSKSLSAMELECSGFIIKNGKLYDSTGYELTWPNPGDSRYSFISDSKLLDQNVFQNHYNQNNFKNDFFNIHYKSSIFNNQNSLNNNHLTDLSLKESLFFDSEKKNFIIPSFSHQKLFFGKDIKENNYIDEFYYKCSNITASSDSFACVSTEINNTNLIYFAHCLDLKCKKTEMAMINLSIYLKTSKIKKMLIFNNDNVAILLENDILYIFDIKGIKQDEIPNITEMSIIDDGISEHLLYLQNNNLYQYKSKLIFKFHEQNKKIQKIIKKVAFGLYKTSLVIFSNYLELNNELEYRENENLIMFCTQNTVDNFVIDKNSIIYAIDYLNKTLLKCNIKTRNCKKIMKLNSTNIQLLPLKRGGFIAISIDDDRRISYHFLSKSNLDDPRIIITKTSEIVDEILLIPLKARYPRIYAIRNKTVTITHCTNSKCYPGFAN